MEPEEAFNIGIDVGGSAIHVVGLDEHGSVVLARVVGPADLASVLQGVVADAVVAIDAPDEQREPRHGTDPAVSRKFRTVRCAEVALGARRGYWVPWVTPLLGTAVPDWMASGFDVWQTVRGLGFRPIEVYPTQHSVFLAGPGLLAKKGTLAGTRSRVDALEAVGVRTGNLTTWSHDSLDATVAAVVERDAREGTAAEVVCAGPDRIEHDGSAIWLPAGVGGTA